MIILPEKNFSRNL